MEHGAWNMEDRFTQAKIDQSPNILMSLEGLV